jgi:hypothetical protein
MSHFWNQYSEPPASGANPILTPNLPYPIPYPHEEMSNFQPDVSATTTTTTANPIDSTQFAQLLNCLFRCESNGLEGTGYILPPTQMLTPEKQTQVFFNCNMASALQDNEL